MEAGTTTAINKTVIVGAIQTAAVIKPDAKVTIGIAPKPNAPIDAVANNAIQVPIAVFTKYVPNVAILVIGSAPPGNALAEMDSFKVHNISPHPPIPADCKADDGV